MKYFIILLTLGFCGLYSTTAHAQDASWFTNATHSAGLDSIINYFIYVADINNDDYPDLILEAGVQTENQIKVLINKQKAESSDPHERIFVDETEASGINQQVKTADLAVLGDVNNDGNIDLITATYYYDSFIRNDSCLPNPDNGGRCEVLLGDGKGHFTLKEGNGLNDLGPIPGSSLSLLDYDRDGNIDLFIGTHYTSWCGVGADKYLMKGRGDGTFINITDQTDISTYTEALFGSNAGDWNNDCNQDILTSVYAAEGTGNLWSNQGNGDFRDVAEEVGYNPHWIKGDNGQAMVPWAAEPYDFDNDGDMDILFLEVHGGTNTKGRSTLFINQGKEQGYKLVPDLTRITRSNPQSSHHGDNQGRFFDIDNDKLADLALTECVYKPLSDRLFIFKQDSSNKFTDITKALEFISGTTNATISDAIRNPHAAEPLDYDLDGDDDLVVGKYPNDKRFLLLRNDIGNKNNWLAVKLKAPDGVNKSAIGARIRVVSGGVSQMRDIYAGQGNFSAQQPFILNFGLASDTKVDTIDVRWPDANCTHTIVTNVTPNQMVVINESGLTSSVRAVPGKPTGLLIHPIFPNPTNSVTTIPFELPQESEVDLSLFDVSGKKVLSLCTGKKQSGKYESLIDTSSLSSGLYSCVLKTANATVVQPLVVSR